MKTTIAVIVAGLCLVAMAAGNTAVATKQAASSKPQTTALGTESISIPQMLSYQGKLTDSLGGPVSDTTYQVTFRLYTVPSGGSAFWTETQTVRTRRGLFSSLLGSGAPIDSVPRAGACYLGMQVGLLSELTPRIRIVSAAYSYLSGRADTSNYALATAGADNAWVRSGSDSVLYTIRELGVARGGAGNMLYGRTFSEVNLGVACTTGTSGQDFGYSSVGGGIYNAARFDYAVVGGGAFNTASGVITTVGGGSYNAASAANGATVGGGAFDTASGDFSSVVGGWGNKSEAFFGGALSGHFNLAGDAAGDSGAVVAGGTHNKAVGMSSFIGGGDSNTASGLGAQVGGGTANAAGGQYATVGGGVQDTASGDYSFAIGNHSVVSGSYANSAAFNGQAATASNQLRCGTLSKTGGSFTIDHPLDPYGKILNHYFVESPDMSNLYSGSVVLDGSGRGEVLLPDYFDALNRNPRVQLTGVGTSDVYVAEDISGNRFVVGGKAGAKVYWQVTGDRKDVSAEAIRRMMPVEQPKTGALAGRMLDDDFLAGCMDQLVREGKAQGIDFRTAAGRQRYEKMKQQLEHP